MSKILVLGCGLIGPTVAKDCAESEEVTTVARAKPPLYYKIVFGGKRMPIRPGKVPMILGGKQVEVDRYNDLEPLYIEGLEDMEAFYNGYPSSLLKLCLEKGVKTFKGKTIRYAGFVDKLMFLLDLGVISKEPSTYKGREIELLDFARAREISKNAFL